MAAFLAGKGGVATGVVAMDTTPPLNPPSSAGSGVSGQSDTAPQPPDQQIGQDSQTSQTSFQEPVQPVEPVQPPAPVFSGDQEQWQWPQTPQDQPGSLRLTATNPELAQVLPPGPVATGTAANGAESANSSSTSMVAPSAPPPTYDQVAASQGATMTYDGTSVQAQNMPVGGIGGYDPAYQQAQAPPPAAVAGSYFPPPYTSPPQGGPYDYQYGAPPAPVGGAGVPSYGQQFSAPGPAPSHSFASTPNWASFDSGSGSSGVPSQQQEPSVPYVDRSTKPLSLTGLSTSWGGKTINCIVEERYMFSMIIMLP